jgi:hypothetical protein
MKQQIISTEQAVTYQKTDTNREFSRILCAAVVNKSFCGRLLADPVKTVSMGYCGEKFQLKEHELRQIASIRVGSLADFAAELMKVTEPITVSMSYASCD